MKIEDLTLRQLLECMEKDRVKELCFRHPGNIDYFKEIMPSIQALLESSGEAKTENRPFERMLNEVRTGKASAIIEPHFDASGRLNDGTVVTDGSARGTINPWEHKESSCKEYLDMLEYGAANTVLMDKAYDQKNDTTYELYRLIKKVIRGEVAAIINPHYDRNGYLDGGCYIEKGRITSHIDPRGEEGTPGEPGISREDAEKEQEGKLWPKWLEQQQEELFRHYTEQMEKFHEQHRKAMKKRLDKFVVTGEDDIEVELGGILNAIKEPTTGTTGTVGHIGVAGINLSEPLRPEDMEVQDFEQTVVDHIIDINKQLLLMPKGERDYIVHVQKRIPRTVFKEIRRRYRAAGWKKVDMYLTFDDVQVGLYR